MNWRTGFSVIVRTCVVLSVAAVGTRGDERELGGRRLPKALETFVQQELVPAYTLGHPAAILQVLRSRLPRLREPQIEQIDNALSNRGLPTIGDMLTQTHLQAMRAKLDVSQEMGLNEAHLAIRHTRDEIERPLATLRNAPLMNDPLPEPATLAEFRDLLWTAHVQKNELLGVKDLVQLGELLTKKLSPNVRRNATQQTIAILDTDFAPYYEQVTRLLRDLDERTLEVQIDCIELAMTTLLEEKDAKQRLMAASVIAVNSDEVIQRIKKGQGQFHRETLNQPSVLDNLISNSRKAEEVAGALIKKSRLLFAGLHWWMRGRYGLGPEGHGLLKAEAAERNPAARVPLFMPKTRPVPTDPMKPSRAVPVFDRRHHYTWAWQDRQFQMNRFRKSGSYHRAATSNDHLDFRLNGRFY